MTGRRLFGVETEYAVAAVATDGTAFPTDDVSGAFMRAAARLLPSLPGAREHGLFLGNGSRLYVDAGFHPELAGPECLNPTDLVRYLRAGDALMLRLAASVRERNPEIAEIRVFAGNVDYSGSRCTWGAHESYCHRAEPEDVRRQLLPHLVSRVIVTGAGGFNPLSSGLEFTLSPRAHFLSHQVSAESTHDRGITHTRDEALASHGYRRAHVLCGESLRSSIGTWLKVGTTALVVALIDGGVPCGEEVQLMAPVAALHAIAGDATCSRVLRTTRGGSTTAIDMQRHYLAQARAHLHKPFMPPWAADVCDRWSDVLDRLSAGVDAVSAMLDWAIKLRIYGNRVATRGFAWGTPPPTASGMIRRDFNMVRGELLEIDTRWAQLGPDGLFTRLEQAGVVVHQVPGVDRIEEAVEQPPAEGRAHVRGSVIRRLADRKCDFVCSWDHLSDCQGTRFLDLTDPFTGSEHWREKQTRSSQPAIDRAEPERAVDTPSVLEHFSRMLGRVRERSLPEDRIER